jgi:hypothetical protein
VECSDPHRRRTAFGSRLALSSEKPHLQRNRWIKVFWNTA